MSEEPAFRIEEMEKLVKKVHDTYKKVTSKKKPIEKKPKEEPKEEAYKGPEDHGEDPDKADL